VLVRPVLAVLLGVVLAAPPGAASAEVLVHRDAPGDVARSPVGAAVFTPAPTQVDGDIVYSRVAHARRAIWIQVRYRDLQMAGNGNFHVVAIKTRWRLRTIEVDAFPGHWEGRESMTDALGQAVACAVTHRIDYDRNRLVLRVPRSCLGKPRWVQVGIRSTVAGVTDAFTDDARTTGLGAGTAFGSKIPL
jgi:hypothetical protein